MKIFSTLQIILALFVANIICLSSGDEYYGRFIGSFPGTVHNVKGSVYAATVNTIYIRGFSYDGAGPDAFFWAGTSDKPDPNGFIIPDELGRKIKLNSYENQNLLLTLPDGKTFRDIRWIAVWCRLFQANFGHVSIPAGFDFPREHNIGRIPTLAHKTGADAVVVKDEKTLFIRNLYYDGAAPDAFFLAGTGSRPHPNGIKIPDETNSLRKLRGYNGKDVILRLPNNLTIFDIDWFGLYCITYKENFGHVTIPKNLNVPPDLQTLASNVASFPNCKTIFPGLLQVSWEVRHPDIYFQLEGRVEPLQYLAFGFSGNPDRSQMVGADVTVVFYDSIKSTAVLADYMLTAKSQCAPQSKSGACPDEMIGGKQDSEMISWNYNDGLLKVSYKRKLDTKDAVGDQEIIVTSPMTVVAAIGAINSKGETAFHNIKFTKASEAPVQIKFRPLQNERTCDSLASKAISEAQVQPWKQGVINAYNGHSFRVVIGPSGGDRGYTPITGIKSWGIAYWVDDMLIPEIHVQRGHNYTFVVEAGDNAAQPARFHPLYITNNKEGGGGQKIEELNTPGHQVYAGINFNNNKPELVGAGRYCELKIKGVDKANEVNTIAEYRKTLDLKCETGNVASFQWTPDENTPDVVYYQCYAHLNLGWKIIVNSSQRLASFLVIHVLLTLITSVIII